MREMPFRAFAKETLIKPERSPSVAKAAMILQALRTA